MASLIPPFPSFPAIFCFICLFIGVVIFSGWYRPAILQVSDPALLPEQDDPQGSLHASGPGAQGGPRLASKANDNNWSQDPPRKWIHLSNHEKLLAPPTVCTLYMTYRRSVCILGAFSECTFKLFEWNRHSQVACCPGSQRLQSNARVHETLLQKSYDRTWLQNIVSVLSTTCTLSGLCCLLFKQQ